MKSFLLIGAGDFGHLLARELSKQPCELMIADINEDALGDLLELGISAKIGDCSREEVLESFDVASFDACFVCVGGHFQTSLEIVYLLEKLHAKKIHCKADDDSQAKFLSIIGADHVILPGVGAFGDAMGRLTKYGLDAVIREVVEREIPLLGICLGLQLMFESSEESPGANRKAAVTVSVQISNSKAMRKSG